MKTKDIIKGLILISLIAFFSCSLNEDPVSGYSEVTVGATNESGNRIKYKDRNEMLTQLNAMYQQMKDDQEYWVLDYLLLAEAHSDNAYAGTPTGGVVPYETNSLNSTNPNITRDWNGYMSGIATANNIICNIDSVPDPAFSESERNQWKAEAKIYRALKMFDMARMWGNFPVITQLGEDITADNISEVYWQYFPSQNTVEEAYTQIEKDLLEALKYAPDNNNSDKTKLSKTVARALLAKVYAEAPLRDYDKVIQYCDEVVADGISLALDYSDLFALNSANTDAKYRNTSESILEIQYSPASGSWLSILFGKDLINSVPEDFTWAKWVTPSRDLISAFQNEKDDVRFNQSVVYYTCEWSNYYPSNEYPFSYKIRSHANSIIKLRLGDILLLKAEALANKNDLPGASGIVNTIRNRAKLGNLDASAASSKENMLNAVLKERRLELAFEGQRWFDLIRYGKMEDVMNAVFSTDVGRLPQKKQFTKDSELLPIPKIALEDNKNLKQNPGY